MLESSMIETEVLSAKMGDQRLRGILEECLKEEDELKQLSHLKRVAVYMKKASCERADVECAVHILVKVYATVEPKSAHRRTVASILQSFPESLHDVTISALSEQLRSSLQAPTEGITPFRRRVGFISGHLENFPLGQKVLQISLKQILPFFHRCLEWVVESARNSTSAVERSALMELCLACLKTIMIVMQKCVGPTTAEDQGLSTLIEEILGLSWEILRDGTFPLECVSAAGLAVALLKRALLGEEESLRQLVQSLLHRQQGDQRDPPGSVTAAVPGSPPMPQRSRLSLLNGVLAMFTPSALGQRMVTNGPAEEEECVLTDIAFRGLMDLIPVITSASLSLFASSTILQWTLVAKAAATMDENLRQSLRASGRVSKEILGYIWKNWNHTVDGIRYKCRSIFEGLLGIHTICDQGIGEEDPFLLDILDRLITYSWHIRSKYGLLVSLVTYFRVDRILVLYPTIVKDLMMAMTEQSIAPYSGELLAALYQQHWRESGEDTSNWCQTWVEPALEIMRGSTEVRQQAKYLTQYFIPGVLKFNPSCLSYMVDPAAPQHPDVVQDSRQLNMVITWLKVARSVGVLKENTKRQQHSQQLWKGFVSTSVLHQALCHNDSQLSADTLSLLCDSSKTTEEFTVGELQLLGECLQLHMASQLAAARQQRVAAIKKMLFRLRESSKSFEKKRLKAQMKGDNEEGEILTAKLEAYKRFIDWLRTLLVGGLAPGSSYPRRTTSLMIFTIIRALFKGEACPILDYQSLWDAGDAPFLLLQLDDTFDTNKVMAYTLLRDVRQETLGWESSAALHSMYDCALSLASSHKPHHCETAAYLLRLLANEDSPSLTGSLKHEDNVYRVLEDLCLALAQQIDRGHCSLLEAAMSGPMYGVLHCVRAILSDIKPGNVADQGKWVTLLQRIVLLCHGVAGVAAPTVCSSSPEGYLPGNSNDTDTGQDTANGVTPREEPPRESTPLDEASMDRTSLEVFQVTPQMVLVCCWRSMKEVSLTLSHLVMTLPLEGDDHHILTCLQVEDIGSLFLKLLKESRHRGAFELAYAGFEKLCATLWRSANPSLASLPRQWLQGLLREVTEGTSVLCATRRSAGLPFAVQALVGSEPEVMGRTNFKHTMSELIKVLHDGSDGDNSVQKVHALNILRSLYRDSRLGEEVIPFLAEGVQAAVRGFASDKWAVRNSSTLLFSALVTRIFGVNREKDALSKKNCMAVREFFSRFPSLLPFLTEQLEKSVQSSDGAGLLHPSLYPTLIILSHLHPSYQEDDTSPSNTIGVMVPLIMRCAGCAVYKTRQMAARAIQAIVPLNDVITVLASLIQSLPSTARDRLNQNHIHGTLLMIWSLIEGHVKMHGVVSGVAAQFFTDIVHLLHSRLWLASSGNRCPTTRAAYMHIVNEAVMDEQWILSASLTADVTTPLDRFRGELIEVALSEFDQSLSSVQPDHVSLISEQASCITKYLHGNITRCCYAEGRTCDELVEDLSVDQTIFSQPDLLLRLLRSPSYEVRSVGLTFLLEEGSVFLQTIGEKTSDPVRSKLGHTDQRVTLQADLVAMAIGKETDLECMEKIFQILSSSCPSDVVTRILEGSHDISSHQFVVRLLELAESNQVRSNLCASVIVLTGKYLENMRVDGPAVLISRWIPIVESTLVDDDSQDFHIVLSGAVGDMLVAVTRHRETIPVPLHIRLWRLVLQLHQQYGDLCVQRVVGCLSEIATITGHATPDGYSPMMHHTQAIHVTVSLFTAVFIEVAPAACLSELCSWVYGSLHEEEDDGQNSTVDDAGTTKLFERGESSSKLDDAPVLTAATKSIGSITAACGQKSQDSSKPGGSSLAEPQQTPGLIGVNWVPNPSRVPSQHGKDSVPPAPLALEKTGVFQLFRLKNDSICGESLRETACTLYHRYYSLLEGSLQKQRVLTPEYAFLETDEFEACWADMRRHIACVRHLADLCQALGVEASSNSHLRTDKLRVLMEERLGEYVGRSLL